ncbi:MAG: Fe-S cluster assembly protein SufB [Bacteroidetes bacterium]|nr:Fe-S cluster assembly protein SufB [Bacteroidota bacterium]MBU1114314.1 Fe-S cluster assembly protein SufB [Bacteroidota bacterium]MBU1797092.1 Fe-S cluster assembly protein SufB [Bacteroidota bacterium]
MEVASGKSEKSLSDEKLINEFTDSEYKWGFVTDIESDDFAKGLSEDVVRKISAIKKEPEWMTEYRVKAYKHWLTLKEPKWPNVKYPEIDFQDIRYYSAPKKQPQLESLDEVDPELLRTFEKLGIPIEEQKKFANVAVDAVFDSVSVKTTFQATLKEKGIIFSPLSEALKEHPELVKEYFGSVVPYTDNFYASLNAAVFSEGSFVYIPKGVRCPMELSTYFRINAMDTGQFERTLVIADEGAYVSYLEGCTAPMRDNNQLHAAVVELVAKKDAEIKYSTVQNWYPGDKDGKGGIYNFVTKRGVCDGDNSKISWTQVETGSAITWKYPSTILKGDNSVGEFYSVAVTNNFQQADTGTKMIHLGKNTKSTIVSKGISAGRSNNSYRGLVKIGKNADGARNYSQCDSMLMSDKCGAHTFPYLEIDNNNSTVEHEATTSKVSEDQIFYLNQRGISTEDAVNLIVNGFCKEVFKQLPMEFAVEATKLLALSLEGSVG